MNRLAEMATVECGQAMDQADILNALREVLGVKNLRSVGESATLIKLQEYKIG
uniref:Uncharacterized protein n=1 Tax=Arion vulgaris TaxID=1028688 RepID=A0A0B7AY19_9EUPU